MLFADTFDGDMPMPPRNYNVMPDGRRFVMTAPTRDAAPETIVVLNWMQELRARLSANKEFAISRPDLSANPRQVIRV